MENIFLSVALALTTFSGASAFLFPHGNHSGWNQHAQHIDCTKVSQYNTLLRLISTDTCVSINHVLPMLEDVYKTGHKDCRIKLIDTLAATFGHGSRTPSQCACAGVDVLQSYHQQGLFEWHDMCYRTSHEYNDLFNEFFTHGGATHTPSCRTHHSLWYPLSRVPHGMSFCQLDLVLHMGHAFKHTTDPCTCGAKTGQTVPTPPPVVTQPPAVTAGHHPHTDETACLKYDSYKKIKLLTTQNRCLMANSVWTDLNYMVQLDKNCFHVLLQNMRAEFGHEDKMIAAECQCAGDPVDNNIPRLSHGHLKDCVHDNAYLELEWDLFDKQHSHGCSTHQFLWSKLLNIHTRHGHDCAADFVKRAATSTYHPCHCEARMSATHPVTHAAATTTTVTPFAVHTSCSKLTTIEDIGTATRVQHPNSTSCVGRTSGSNEDFTLVHCVVPPFPQWRKGPNVMQRCAQIPAFTPVATFPPHGDVYSPNGAQSGVFLGCLADGFKLAIQKCNGDPTIEHLVTGGVFTADPSGYYVIA